jgi:hypothetical protein
MDGVEPWPATLVPDQSNFACGDLAVLMRDEIDPGRNVVDIHKNIFPPNRFCGIRMGSAIVLGGVALLARIYFRGIIR